MHRNKVYLNEKSVNWNGMAKVTFTLHQTVIFTVTVPRLCKITIVLCKNQSMVKNQLTPVLDVYACVSIVRRYL